MIKNYLKTSLRYLLQHKQYTVINILGLAVSIACCILIMLFVRSELSYDAFHSKSDRMFRVWERLKIDNKGDNYVVTPLPAADVIKSTFPEVETTSRVYYFNPIVKIGQNTFTEDVDMVDPSFFTMFNFSLTEGNPNNPFPIDNSVVLTQGTAKKYFGNNDAIGKSIEMQLGDDKILLTVSGIINEAPVNSSIRYHALIPYNTNAKHLFAGMMGMLKSWVAIAPETYILLKPGANAMTVEKKFPEMVKQQLGTNLGNVNLTMHLQPIKDIHLNTSLPAGNEPISDPKYSYILGTIGFLILIVACINFITLSIGQSTKRALEVGVRKALGAERGQLILQFWGESFLVILFSVIVGISMAVIFLKPFNILVNRQLSFQFDLYFVLFCVLIIAVIAIISGIYPALILSGFNPVEVLKGKVNMKGGKGMLRHVLVIAQFSFSIVMVIGTVIIGQQMHYLLTKDLGYKKDQVIVVTTNKSVKEGMPLAVLYRNELMKHPQVLNASVSAYSFVETPWVRLTYQDEKKNNQTIQYNSIDPNFLPAMGIKMVSGRNFDAGNTADITGAALVNEAYIKDFDLTDPIGKKLPGPFSRHIIGVVKDFNYQSLHTKIQPLVMTVMTANEDSLINSFNSVYDGPLQARISIQLKAGNISDNINMLKQVWATVAPEEGFDYKFLDETIAAQYKQEQRTNMIVQISSGLSIFIACMGLFGIATLSVIKRIKEIGIRKVLGANVISIVKLLSIDFIKLVFIAAIIASPIAWWAMNEWLQNFTYRIEINWWVFILAGLIAMLIALVTISYQTIKAALSNPVKSLKTE